jgi:hypothetical protein
MTANHSSNDNDARQLRWPSREHLDDHQIQMEPIRSVALRGDNIYIYMIDCFPPDAAREAVSTLIELHDLWKADVLVGSEIADSALDDAAYALYRSGLLDDLVRRVSRTYRPDVSG